MKHFIVFPLLLAATLTRAETCPDVPDHTATLDALIAEANAAKTEMQARSVSGRMWEIWADAPDEAAQAILDRGIGKLRASDLLGARADFDRLVAYCPDYAEGYNQRAFANYLRQDYAGALPDLDAALARSPRHVAALAGKALTLTALGQVEEARTTLLQALELNPWLSERRLMDPGGPLAPKGQDI